jgi:hypothetical protein
MTKNMTEQEWGQVSEDTKSLVLQSKIRREEIEAEKELYRRCREKRALANPNQS